MKYHFNLSKTLKDNLVLIDIVSILLFALLGNFIFSVSGEIDFEKRIDILFFIKLFFLTSASSCLYSVVYRLKRIETSVARDYERDNKINKQERYEKYFKDEKTRIITLLFSSIICCSLFFLIEPIAKNFFVK